MNGIDAAEEAQRHDAALDDEQAAKAKVCTEEFWGKRCTRLAEHGEYCAYHFAQISNTFGT